MPISSLDTINDSISSPHFGSDSEALLSIPIPVPFLIPLSVGDDSEFDSSDSDSDCDTTCIFSHSPNTPNQLDRMIHTKQINIRTIHNNHNDKNHNNTNSTSTYKNHLYNKSSNNEMYVPCRFRRSPTIAIPSLQVIVEVDTPTPSSTSPTSPIRPRRRASTSSNFAPTAVSRGVGVIDRVVKSPVLVGATRMVGGVRMHNFPAASTSTAVNNASYRTATAVETPATWIATAVVTAVASSPALDSAPADPTPVSVSRPRAARGRRVNFVHSPMPSPIPHTSTACSASLKVYIPSSSASAGSPKEASSTHYDSSSTLSCTSSGLRPTSRTPPAPATPRRLTVHSFEQRSLVIRPTNYSSSPSPSLLIPSISPSHSSSLQKIRSFGYTTSILESRRESEVREEVECESEKHETKVSWKLTAPMHEHVHAHETDEGTTDIETDIEIESAVESEKTSDTTEVFYDGEDEDEESEMVAIRFHQFDASTVTNTNGPQIAASSVPASESAKADGMVVNLKQARAEDWFASSRPRVITPTN